MWLRQDVKDAPDMSSMFFVPPVLQLVLKAVRARNCEAANGFGLLVPCGDGLLQHQECGYRVQSVTPFFKWRHAYI